jgi:hypothetical protein
MRTAHIKPLSDSDMHHLRAAQGWVELGNHLEADTELEKIEDKYRIHPDVLEVRWGIYARQKQRSSISTSSERTPGFTDLLLCMN